MKYFGDRLREERKRLRLTQEELAEKTGVRPITILQYEKEKSSPSIKFIYSLSHIGFNLTFLFLGSKEIEELSDYPKEFYKEIADTIENLELKLGSSIDKVTKVKLTCFMLKKYSISDKNHNFSLPDMPTLFSDVITDL